MKAASHNGENEASDDRNDKEGDLDGRDILLGVVVRLDVLTLVFPVGDVKRVGVNDDLSIFVVLSGLDIVDEVTHLFPVCLLLGRL